MFTKKRMKKEIVKAEQLSKTYTDGIVNPVIKKINLSINDGEFCSIMGNSGSGKSTLLYLLSGLDSISSGKIWINDIPLHDRKEKDLAIVRRKQIGFVFQENNMVNNLTVRENVLVAGYLTLGDRKYIRQYAEYLLEELGIIDISDRYPAKLSGGERQRAAIVRALINKPKVLFADEPTGSLNSESAEKVLDCFSALHKNGQTIIMVTHDPKSAQRADRVLFLKDGEICFERSKETLQVKNDYNELYIWLKEIGW